MLPIAFEGFGEDVCPLLCEGSLFLHHADDVGNEVAIEGGVLLLAWGIYLRLDLMDGEDIAPEGLVAIVPIGRDGLLEVAHIVDDVGCALEFVGCGPRKVVSPMNSFSASALLKMSSAAVWPWVA